MLPTAMTTPTKKTTENKGVIKAIADKACSPSIWPATILSTSRFAISTKTEIDAVKSIDLRRRPQNVFAIRNEHLNR